MNSMKNSDTRINNATLKIVWSPAAKWLIDENGLKIQIYRYRGKEKNLFPEFYYITQKGVLFYELIESFPNFEKKILERFILDLYQKRILVNTPLKIKELFYTQNNLFENDYSSSIRSEEHTSELQSRQYLVCRLLLEKKKNIQVHLN